MILEANQISKNVDVNKRKPKIGFNLIKQKQNRCIEQYKKHHTQNHQFLLVSFFHFSEGLYKSDGDFSFPKSGKAEISYF